MLLAGAVVWLGVFVLPYLLSSLPPYSLSTHHPLLKKADLAEQWHVRAEIYLQPYFLSYSVAVQGYALKNLLAIALAFKNTSLLLICSVGFMLGYFNTLQRSCSLCRAAFLGPAFQLHALKIASPAQ